MHTHREHLARRRQATWIMIGLLLPWLSAAGDLFGGERHETASGITERDVPFVLTVHEGRISLQAQDASLKAIAEELGRQLDIEVVATIPSEDRVTLVFDRLSLEAAITRLRKYAKVIYITEKEKKKITKILIFAKQESAARHSSPTETADMEESGRLPRSAGSVRDKRSSGEPQRPGTFKFEFDPAKLLWESR